MSGKKSEQNKELQAAAKGMAWRINIYSTVAVYVQIENLVKFALAAGKLLYMDQLPSVRELSERLEVNPNTVAKAYRDLEVMGLVYTRRGMGVYISKTAPASATSMVGTEVSRRIVEVAREAGAAGFDMKGVVNQVKVQMRMGADGEPIYT